MAALNVYCQNIEYDKSKRNNNRLANQSFKATPQCGQNPCGKGYPCIIVVGRFGKTKDRFCFQRRNSFNASFHVLKFIFFYWSHVIAI